MRSVMEARCLQAMGFDLQVLSVGDPDRADARLAEMVGSNDGYGLPEGAKLTLRPSQPMFALGTRARRMLRWAIADCDIVMVESALLLPAVMREPAAGCCLHDGDGRCGAARRVAPRTVGGLHGHAAGPSGCRDLDRGRRELAGAVYDGAGFDAASDRCRPPALVVVPIVCLTRQGLLAEHRVGVGKPACVPLRPRVRRVFPSAVALCRARAGFCRTRGRCDASRQRARLGASPPRCRRRRRADHPALSSGTREPGAALFVLLSTLPFGWLVVVLVDRSPALSWTPTLATTATVGWRVRLTVRLAATALCVAVVGPAFALVTRSAFLRSTSRSVPLPTSVGRGGSLVQERR